MAQFTPQDQEARRRIRESLNETLFVEAGAGTGKTTSLVDRVVGLAASGRTTLDRMAVITFTEAAAAELRDRVREGLEEAVSSPDVDEEERERCQTGLDDLDRASIQTLHSFAGALLRERPLEAGLPPVFETMDAIASDLAFDDEWKGWVDRALEDEELAGPLTMVFSLGLNLEGLRTVGRAFHENYDMLEFEEFADAPEPEAIVVRDLLDGAGEMERLCQYSKIGVGDRLYDHVQAVLRALDRLKEMEPGSSSSYRLLSRALPLSQTGGRQPDWDTDSVSGVNACKRLKDWLSDLNVDALEELAEVRRWALMPVLRAIKGFALEFAEERKRRGTAAFHDLLVWARDLLRYNLEVRDYFRQRFTHLLVDEAQDTDPLQAEIVAFISEGASAGSRVTNWLDVKPERGKLFVVGDPKQSIYRFRRADVGQMVRLQELMGGDTVHLVQNFRSQRPVLEWVNALFEQWMEEGAEQADYVPVAHRWEADTDHRGGPRVWRIGEVVDGPVAEARAEEAGYIAGLLHGVVASGWQVLDPAATADAGTEHYRDARYADICILMPRRSGLLGLELALDEAGAPYRLEGNSLIYATQEVRDLVNCLKAIDDPADQVATVAALRSPAFACSDIDLFEFSQAGGQFNCLTKSNPATGPVGEALTVMQGFHHSRLWASLPALIEGLIRHRRLMESAIDHPRTREQWRRYRFMVEQARIFVESGGNSLRAFLDWLERQAEERARVSESAAPESDEDAVRIMTVHAAKGLEFPIAILTGIGGGERHSRGNVLFDRETGAVEVRMGTEAARFETPGFRELREREDALEDDEYVRLMYVAATRARDHLVVSLFRGRRTSGSGAARIEGFLEGYDELWEVPEGYVGGAPQIPQVMTPIGRSEGHSRQAREEWANRRTEMLAFQGRPSSVAATKLRQVFTAPQEEEGVQAAEPWRRGRGGTTLGRAVHSVLQTIDLATGRDIEETARAQAAAEGIPDRWSEVARLARVALDSDTVKKAVAASGRWREVPVAAPVGDGVLEGFIDLLYEDANGLVVVDYKTDAVDSENLDETLEGYRMQGGAYALAAAKATGKLVKEVVFLFLHAGEARTLTDVDGLMAEAEAAAIEYLSGAATGAG